MTTPGLIDLCSALLPPECGGPPPDRLARTVDRFVAKLPRSARRAVRAGVAGVAVAAWARAGRRLAMLPPEARAGQLSRMARRPAGAQAIDGLKTLVLLVAGSEAGAMELAAWSGRMPLARPDPELDVTPASSWPSATRCDVVVIGSGAGGAAVARTLARAGLRTVVVEEGRPFGVEEFRTTHPLDRFASLYR